MIGTKTNKINWNDWDETEIDEQKKFEILVDELDFHWYGPETNKKITETGKSYIDKFIDKFIEKYGDEFNIIKHNTDKW